MEESVATLGRGTFRRLHWCVAIGALVAFLYFLGTHLGLLNGITGPTHSLLLLGSSTTLIWSFLVLQRTEAMGIVLILISLLLLVGSIVNFVQNY